MGSTHMLGGTTAWLTVCAFATPSAGVITAGAAVATGAALINDIDHEHSIARSILGPITWTLSWVIRRGCGGQRRITHCIIGTALFIAGVEAAARHWNWPPWVLTAIGAGWVSHILLDMCTEQGCPLLWPLSKLRFGLPHDVAVTTGGKRKNGKRRKGVWGKLTEEHLIVDPALAAGALFMAVLIVRGVKP